MRIAGLSHSRVDDSPFPRLFIKAVRKGREKALGNVANGLVRHMRNR